VVGEISEGNVDCSPASTGHAERGWKHHAAVIGDMNCVTPPRRSGSTILSALLLHADQLIE
jgi:hypothetical protein